MARGVVLAWIVVAALASPGAASAAREGGPWCCWKITVKATGTFAVGYEPRVSADPSVRGHHVFGDALGRYSVRWKWESRGLYSYRELRDGRRRIPVLDSLGSGRGFELATTARGEVSSFEEYCLIEHDTDRVDGEVVVVAERCEAPPINPCLLSQVSGWKPGGASSGVRLQGGDPGDKRTFLSVWVQGLFPYDGKCVQFGSISHGTTFGAAHGMTGPYDYVSLAPRKIDAKLRGRRSFAFAPRTGDYTAFRGLRPRVSGVHPPAGGDDEQPHTFGGKTSVSVKFTYFPMSKLRREQSRLRSPGVAACRKPTLKAAPAAVERGAPLTLTGACFKPGKVVTFYIGPPGTTGDRVASARTNARGAFSKRYVTSKEAAPGTYVVIACQNACRVKAQTRVELK